MNGSTKLINMKQPYKPPYFPLKLDYGRFAKELAQAEYSIGLLEGSQRKLQNPSLLISPLTAKEATVSSKIEGTVSTTSDVFLFEAGGSTDKKDTLEVVNYRRAMLDAIEWSKAGTPFSLTMIKGLHQKLLTDVRHRGVIGTFRAKQVYIANRPTDDITKATYIPPESVLVPDYMDNILGYINSDSDPALVKAGLVHYQFEAVHPFEDGNGRIGRLLIPLLLHLHRRLSLPMIYVSGYLEEHRDQYIETLHSVDENQTYEEWLTFFLKAINAQACETQKLVDAIYSLNDEVKQSFVKLKSPYIRTMIDCIFRNPVFTIADLERALGATRLTCTKLLSELAARGYIREFSFRLGREKLYGFSKLLDLIK